MVRLVFRPYTRVRRTICTSVSLRASTRVSSGFAPLRHSSPSFGSQHACSHSNPSHEDQGRSAVHLPRGSRASASLGPPGFDTRRLASMSGSLVRVPRRVERGAHGPLQRARWSPRGGTPSRRALFPEAAATVSPRATIARALAAGLACNGPRLEPSHGPDASVPLRAEAHRQPPSASLPAISSTL